MMKYEGKKLAAALMAGVLGLAALSACSSTNPPVSSEAPGTNLETPAPAQYDFPSMGLTATLPEALLERMKQNQVAMLNGEMSTEDGSALQYGFLSWNVTAEEDQNTDTEDTGIELDNMECIGVLGVYQAGLVDQLDELTGCDEHKEVGQSTDGAYKYYLSTSTKADEKLTAEILQIQVTITEMAPYQSDSDSDTPQSEFSGTSLGEFTTQDVNGNTYTQDLFKDYDLTLVNVFTTWCSPCVAEIPDLEKLHQQMAERGVNVIGVVLDVLDENGEIVQDSLEQAQLLAEQTGATYPFLLPDATYMNGRLTGIQAFPETFFVDKDGNIVGETYSGSGSLEYWLEVVEQELANVKGDAS